MLEIKKETSVENLYDMLSTAQNPFQIAGVVHAMSYADDGLANILNKQYISMKKNNFSFNDIKSKLLDTIDANMVAVAESKSKKTERTRRSNKDFINMAYDLIADYLYQETGRDAVALSEIKDYIYNDVCDDEWYDYEPTQNEITAIVRRLQQGGYKVYTRR